MGVPGSDLYTSELHKVHSQLSNAIWLRFRERSDEEQVVFINQIENALAAARSMMSEVRVLLTFS